MCNFMLPHLEKHSFHALLMKSLSIIRHVFCPFRVLRTTGHVIIVVNLSSSREVVRREHTLNMLFGELLLLVIDNAVFKGGNFCC